MKQKQFDDEIFNSQVNQLQSTKRSKKCTSLRWFLIICAVIIVVYSCFWYFLTGYVQTNVEASVQDAARHGVDVKCQQLSKTGYPLSVGLACSDFSINFTPQQLDNPKQPLNLENLLANKKFNKDNLAGKSSAADPQVEATLNTQDNQDNLALGGKLITAAAPVYAPHWALIDMASPAWLKLPFGEEVSLNWQSLQLEGNFTSKKPRNVIVSAEILAIANLPFLKPEQQLAVDFFHYNSKTLPDNKASIKAVFDNLTVPYKMLQAHVVPQMDGDLDVTLDDADSFYDAVQQYLQKPDASKFRNQTGYLNKLSLSFEKGGGFTLSGPLAVSSEGKINGDVKITINDSTALMRTIRSIFPSQAGNLRSLFFVLNSMPKNKNGEPQLDMEIVDSNIRVGFLRLGKIPAL